MKEADKKAWAIVRALGCRYAEAYPEVMARLIRRAKALVRAERKAKSKQPDLQLGEA